MSQHLLVQLASIFVLGIGAQWLAWRLRLPSILLLLLCGIVVGPVLGWLRPDQMFGPLLFPLVSLSVAIILFEGGLGLRVAELRETGNVVVRLVTVGAMTTFVILMGAAHFVAGLNLPLATLLASVLVVTGPTVIGPLLTLVRPKNPVGAILRWEGIVIDPIGALLTLLVYEGVTAETQRHAALLIVQGIALTFIVGTLMGAAIAGLLFVLLKRRWIPDHLQSAVSLMFVLGGYAASNLIYHDSGLLAVTVMGISLANQNEVGVRSIVEFKENLRVLLLAFLFILLASRLQIGQLTHHVAANLAFLAIVIFVARPAAALISTVGSALSWRERLFLCWMAPRGIVAASISSVFALQLYAHHQPQTERLVPLTFLVIIGTVSLYGLTALPVARWLRVAKPDAQGLLIVGAHSWAVKMAEVLQTAGFSVVLVDTNWGNVAAARMAGLPAHYANILSDNPLDATRLEGIGRLLALTSNDGVNSLATLHYSDVFGRENVYQLVPQEARHKAREFASPHHLHGRYLFGVGLNYAAIDAKFSNGAAIKATPLTTEFDYKAYQKHQGADTVALFLVSETRALLLFSPDDPLTPRPGQTIISLVSAQPRLNP